MEQPYHDDSPATTKRRRRQVPTFFLGILLGLTLVVVISITFLVHGGLSSSDEVKNVFFVNHQNNNNNHRKLLEEEEEEKKPPLKILYVITSLAEYNTGSRATVKGSDRLQETMIPVLAEGVNSLLMIGSVDVFIVAHYTLLPERLQLIRDALPDSVGLNHWDDAMPLGYNTGDYQENDGKSKIGERALSLARQHRFVVRDHLMDYDLFLNFEDDMLIKAEQVRHYIDVTNELERLKAAAPSDLPGNPGPRVYGAQFHGPMTKGQLSRMIPGFIRVEVLLDKNFQTKQSPVPVDLVFDNENRTIDPAPCCHVSEEHTSAKRPSHPTTDQIMFWETEILPLGVRKMPINSELLDWVGLLRGPTTDKEMKANTIIGDYWSGTDGYFDKQRRPSGNARNQINNMGGWMATRKQIWDWHTQICPGGFLPPYEAPHFRFDGLDLRDVEWWSGGLHLVTKRHACNLQRIIDLHPNKFQYHLLYHTANNKQNSLPQNRFTKANDLLGELNTVRKNAERKMLASQVR